MPLSTFESNLAIYIDFAAGNHDERAVLSLNLILWFRYWRAASLESNRYDSRSGSGSQVAGAILSAEQSIEWQGDSAATMHTSPRAQTASKALSSTSRRTSPRRAAAVASRMSVPAPSASAVRNTIPFPEHSRNGGENEFSHERGSISANASLSLEVASSPEAILGDNQLAPMALSPPEADANSGARPRLGAREGGVSNGAHSRAEQSRAQEGLEKPKRRTGRRRVSGTRPPTAAELEALDLEEQKDAGASHGGVGSKRARGNESSLSGSS